MDSRSGGRRLAEAVRRLAASGGDPAPVACPEPVFLLSAGWRSGSTLVQRLVASDRRTLVWGEPFGDRTPIHRMAEMIEPWCDGDAHAAHAVDRRAEGEPLHASWIANLNPGAGALRAAHTAWFETLFAAPARARGFERWGCKWVRLTAWHAHYLRWLYPRARIVLLVRHPLAAWASYRALGETWYWRRPDVPIRRAEDFLRHWGEVADSFLSERRGLRALLVRYEDVVARKQTVEALARFLGSEIDPATLERRIGAAERPAGARTDRRARAWLRRHLGETARALGYEVDGGVREPAPD